MKQKHKTMKNWCCACEYDQAVFEDMLENMVRAERERIVKMIEGEKKKEHNDLAGNPSEWKLAVMNWNGALQTILDKIKEKKEEEKEICARCGIDCSDGCYTRVDNKPKCDACKETL